MAATRLLFEMSMPWNGGLSLGEDLRLSGLSDSQESQLLYWKSEPKSPRVNLKGFTQETTKLRTCLVDVTKSRNGGGSYFKRRPPSVADFELAAETQF